jgi:hypothetical protein
MTEATVTFKEVLTGDQTLLKRVGSFKRVTGHLRTLGGLRTFDTTPTAGCLGSCLAHP